MSFDPITVNTSLVIRSSVHPNCPLCCPGMVECMRFVRAGGAGPADCSQSVLHGQPGIQSAVPVSDGEVPETAGPAGGSHLCLWNLEQKQARKTPRMTNMSEVL